jgi:hypothetical protein
MQIVGVSDFTEGPTALNGKERSYRRLLAITELIALVDPEVTCLDEVGLRSGFLSFTEGLQEVLREVYSHGACDMNDDIDFIPKDGLAHARFVANIGRDHMDTIELCQTLSLFF